MPGPKRFVGKSKTPQEIAREHEEHQRKLREEYAARQEARAKLRPRPTIKKKEISDTADQTRDEPA